MDLKTYRTKADAINADLDALFAKHGFKRQKISASVAEYDGTVRYSITVADANLKDKDGNAADPDRLYYQNSALYLGLQSEWLDQSFKAGGATYKVVGLKNTRAKNKVVIVKDGETGRRVCPVEFVVSHFELAAFKAAEAARKAVA